jgi:translation initiation factor IF-3
MKKVKTSVIMIKEVYFGKNINNHEVKVKIKKVHVSLWILKQYPINHYN